MFNWSPKDWRTFPTYNLKDQSNEIDLELMPHFSAIASIQERKKDRYIFIAEGVINLKVAEQLLETYSYKSLNDYLKGKKDE